MKYNPKVNEVIARIPGFSRIHPYQPTETVQGALELLYNLQEELAVITGMDAVTVQPSAGAQGEWTGLMMVKAYHEKKGETRTRSTCTRLCTRYKPCECKRCWLNTAVTIPSKQDGLVDLEELKKHVDSNTAALMLTNPNTLGFV